MRESTAVCCAHCDQVADDFIWMAHLHFCESCMEMFAAKGWIARLETGEGAFTEAGMSRFPGMSVAGCCPRDGMPIYRRWIDAEIATMDACPYCMGTESRIGEIRNIS